MQRDSYWDNAKYILIMLVVIGHFAAIMPTSNIYVRYMFNVIYTFHMPLFVFISGMFSKSVINGKRFRVERVISFLIVYLSYIIVRYAMCYIHGTPIRFRLFVEDGLPWYMLAMMVWLCLTFCVREINSLYMFAFSLLASFAIGFEKNIGDVMALNRIVIYWPFFLAGYYLEAKTLETVFQKRSLRFIGAGIIAIYLIMLKVHHSEYSQIMGLFTGRHSYESIKTSCEWFSPWMRLAYYPYIAIIGAGILCLIPHRKMPLITHGGSRTLQIYYLHRLVLYLIEWTGFYTFVTDRMQDKRMQAVFLMVCGVILTVLLTPRILGKPFDEVMRLQYSNIIKREQL